MANTARNYCGQDGKVVNISKRGTSAVIRAIQHNSGHFLPSEDATDNVDIHSDIDKLWREGRKVSELGVLHFSTRFRC